MSSKEKPKISKFTKVLVVIFLIVLIGYFLVDLYYGYNNYLSAYNPIIFVLEKMDERPLIEDTNVKKIRINQTVTLGDIEYNIKSLNIGDNFSALYFNVNGISCIRPIKGVKLYQNEEILPYIMAGSSSDRGAAIGFAPADGYENLELHFDTIEDYKKNQYVYPLDFAQNKATIDVELNGTIGQVAVILSQDDYEIESTGLENLQVKREFGNSSPLVFTLLQDGRALKDFSSQNKPTHINILVKESIYKGDTIIIPVS